MKTIYAGVIGLTILFYMWLTQPWWKLGFSIINTGFVVLVAWIYGKKMRGDKLWWTSVVISIVLGMFLTLRSSEPVNALNVMAVIFTNIMLGALAKMEDKKIGAGVAMAAFFKFLEGWLNSYVETGKNILGWRKKGLSGWKKVVVGTVIAIPFLIIFGGLFYSADPIFANFLNQINFPKIDLSKIINPRTIMTLMFFGAMMGVLVQKAVDKKFEYKTLGQTSELQIAAMIIQGLFLIFTAIQIRYFGVGAETLKSMGISFSVYTRQGYGQMIVASILAWGIVIGLDYILQSQKKLEDKKAELTKRLGAAFLIEILIFIVAATKRNWLYQSAYGFTQARLLGFWLSGWLLALLAITAVKLIKDKDENFLTRSLIVSGMITLVGLNLFNLDRTIVTARPAKLAQGVDYEYMASLSNDAWVGWEEIIRDTENRVENNEISSSNEAGRLRYLTERLQMRKELLKRQSENDWNWGGSWNAVDTKALNYLLANEDRINRLAEKLTTLEYGMVDRKNTSNDQNRIPSPAPVRRK